MKRGKSKSDAGYPVMCEPELELRAKTWNAKKRRRMASILQRWAAQLLCSAELIERSAWDERPADVPAALREDIAGMNKAECLELAARLEDRARRIRAVCGVLKAEHSQPPALAGN